MAFLSMMLDIVANVMDVSSDHVPAGWLYDPCPSILVTGWIFKLSLCSNSTGTPKASPMSKPIIPSLTFMIIPLQLKNLHKLMYSTLHQLYLLF